MENKTMGNVNKRWFQNAFLSRGITQRRVAKHLHLDPSAISLMLRGKRALKLDEAAELARLLSIPVEDVMTNAGINTRTVESKDFLEVRGWVDEAWELHLGTPKGPRKAPPVAGGSDGSKKGGGGIAVARFQTAGTSLDGLDGSLLYFPTPREGIVSADAMGRLSVVQLRDGRGKSGKGRLLVRILKRGYQQGHFNLHAMDGRIMEDDVMVEAAVPVLWHRL